MKILILIPIILFYNLVCEAQGKDLILFYDGQELPDLTEKNPFFEQFFSLTKTHTLTQGDRIYLSTITKNGEIKLHLIVSVNDDSMAIKTAHFIILRDFLYQLKHPKRQPKTNPLVSVLETLGVNRAKHLIFLVKKLADYVPPDTNQNTTWLSQTIQEIRLGLGIETPPNIASTSFLFLNSQAQQKQAKYVQQLNQYLLKK